MEYVLLLIDGITGKIKALGMDVNINAITNNVKISVNGVDLLKNVNLDELKVFYETEEEK